MWTTKRLSITVLITFFSVLVVRHMIVNGTSSGASRMQILHTNPLAWLSNPVDAPVASPENTQVVPVPTDASSSSNSGNPPLEGFQWLDTWNHMKQLANISSGLPHATEAINDARTAWANLTISVQNASSPWPDKERLCPYSIRRMNASESQGSDFTVDIPCGLVAGSSVTVIGTPGSLSGNFWIDLVGTTFPGESEKPIVLHYNVRLNGDKLTEGPIIVQNAFLASNGWGYEDRCPGSNFKNASEGLEGIHMTVDGKHITSFAYRVGLEPWFVTEVRISGDFKLVSAIASGLPTSEDLENSFDLEMLKSSPIPDGKDLDLLIGIFSTANNFKHRMAIRRTWMQYDVVRNGTVAIRFFVGLMKTDDDAFVRVDKIHSSVQQLNVSKGLLYGRINSDSAPHRNRESKWYISSEEWPGEKYPPWAHGPGYVVSVDIAKTINIWYKTSSLKMFKLEDVAMGIWVNEMKKGGLPVRYETDERIHINGCKEGYIVAHYQEPRDMLCMWEKLLRTNKATCCT